VQFLVRDEGGFWHEWRIRSYGPRRYSSTVVRGLPRKMLYVIAESANSGDDSFDRTVWRAEGEIDNSSGEEQEVELIARRATEVSLEVNNGMGYLYSILDEGGHTVEHGRLGLSPVTVWLLPGSYSIEFEDGAGSCSQKSFAVGTRWIRVDLP